VSAVRVHLEDLEAPGDREAPEEWVAAWEAAAEWAVAVAWVVAEEWEVAVVRAVAECDRLWMVKKRELRALKRLLPLQERRLETRQHRLPAAKHQHQHQHQHPEAKLRLRHQGTLQQPPRHRPRRIHRR